MAHLVPRPLRAAGGVVRQLAQAFESAGVAVQGGMAAHDTLLPSTRVVELDSKALEHDYDSFVARSATTVGDVVLGRNSSVWYSATVRGDVGSVKIGEDSSVLDGAVVTATADNPTTIGSSVTVAQCAIVNGATLENGCMVGIGAKVGPGAVVGMDSFVDAGAVVEAGTVVGAGELWAGAPAEKVRALTDEEMTFLRASAGTNVALSRKHAEQDNMSVEEVEDQEYVREYKFQHHLDERDPLPEVDKDTVEYFKIAHIQEDIRLFRRNDYDDGETYVRHALEEAAADQAEDEYYRNLASLNRVGNAIKELGQIPPQQSHAREELLVDLEETDPKAALYLRDLMRRAMGASESEALALHKELKTLDPFKGRKQGFTPEEEVEILSGHAAQLLGEEAAGAAAIEAGQDR